MTSTASDRVECVEEFETPDAEERRYTVASRLSASNEVIFVSEPPAQWFTAILQALDRISRLAENWDSYGGRPLRPEIRRYAESLLSSTETDSIPVPNVVLTHAGNIQLEWRKDDRELEVEVCARGVFEYLKLSANGASEEDRVHCEVVSRLRGLLDWLDRGQ